MKISMTVKNLIMTTFLAIVANGWLLLRQNLLWLILMIPLFLILFLLPLRILKKTKSKRWIFCHLGGELLAYFVWSLIPSIIYHVVLIVLYWETNKMSVIHSALFCIAVSAFVFWFGIICVYCSSVQLGIKWRVVGALCGMIPIANLIILGRIIRTVVTEVAFECQKEQINRDRKAQQVCATKYPILLVHGVFFRDSKRFNYWGRIPKELIQNGATVFYGEHQSALSVADSAAELNLRIKNIIETTGCEKLHIIAHSKGGLDCRYAIAKLDAAPYVASLTTINTPHKGCLFADRLLNFAPDPIKEKVADIYNGAARKLGDLSPDFLAAVSDLTVAACERYDQELIVPDPIIRRSVGSKLNTAQSGQFPLNFSYRFVKYYDGANDGLVGENSFPWGDSYVLLTHEGKRGISHGDMIDLNRENLEGFDVREFYVSLVSELKQRGL